MLIRASFFYIYVQGRPNISTDDVAFIPLSCISRKVRGGSRKRLFETGRKKPRI